MSHLDSRGGANRHHDSALRARRRAHTARVSAVRLNRVRWQLLPLRSQTQYARPTRDGWLVDMTAHRRRERAISVDRAGRLKQSLHGRNPRAFAPAVIETPWWSDEPVLVWWEHQLRRPPRHLAAELDSLLASSGKTPGPVLFIAELDARRMSAALREWLGIQVIERGRIVQSSDVRGDAAREPEWTFRDGAVGCRMRSWRFRQSVDIEAENWRDLARLDGRRVPGSRSARYDR